MNPSRYSVSTETRGVFNAYGRGFDDTPSPKDFPDAVISQISIRYARLVDSLQVHYTPANINAFNHGGDGGGLGGFSLDEGEIITAVEGSFTNEAICHLTFVTDKRRIGPYGRQAGQIFTFTAGEAARGHPARRMALLSFSGQASHFVLALRATFAEVPHRRIPSEIVKYEKVLAEGAREQSSSAPGSTPVSQFAGCLMTPSVTLSVGPNGTKFYANEETLCRLPFFKAALQGGFREAAEKTIDMPQDDAFAVAAMIEFLYTGSYTYAYNSTNEDAAGLEKAPAGTLAEGLFHVAVCTTASKYDCPQLKVGAWTTFGAVLQESSDIDRLRLWKAAYNDGLQLPEFDDDPQKVRAQEELRRWVGVLFKDHREEVDAALFEDQQLACDLLRLATVTLG